VGRRTGAVASVLETPVAESTAIDYSAAVRLGTEHYLLFFRMQSSVPLDGITSKGNYKN
jgi:hypothetical protein